MLIFNIRHYSRRIGHLPAGTTTHRLTVTHPPTYPRHHPPTHPPIHRSTNSLALYHLLSSRTSTAIDTIAIGLISYPNYDWGRYNNSCSDILPITLNRLRQAKLAVQIVINYEEGAENCVLHPGDTHSEVTPLMPVQWWLRFKSFFFSRESTGLREFLGGYRSKLI